jgi:hypothetical protein
MSLSNFEKYDILMFLKNFRMAKIIQMALKSIFWFYGNGFSTPAWFWKGIFKCYETALVGLCENFKFYGIIQDGGLQMITYNDLRS